MKKYMLILLSFMTLMMSFPISASGEGALINGTLSIENYSAQSGETIDVEVILNDNPGITALSFDIEYDSDRLELIKAEDGKILGTSTALFGNDTTANPYRLCWDDLSTENNMGNGTVAILTIKVKDNAPSGIASVGLILNQGSTFNVDMEDVAFTTESGGINVTRSQVQETTAIQTVITTTTTASVKKTTTTTSTTKPTASSTQTSTTTTNTAAEPAITTTSPDISTTVKLGDVNTDGSVDALDASMVLSDYAMKATGHESSFNAEQSKAADLNSDGAVDALDASLILSYYAYKATGGNKSITEYLK